MTATAERFLGKALGRGLAERVEVRFIDHATGTERVVIEDGQEVMFNGPDALAEAQAYIEGIAYDDEGNETGEADDLYLALNAKRVYRRATRLTEDAVAEAPGDATVVAVEPERTPVAA